MKKTPNIFVDCHVFDGNFQGSTTYIKGIYTALTKDKGKHFFLAATNIEILKSTFGTAENITYIQYRSHNKFIRLLFDIPKIIKRNKIDFAHFQYVVPPFKYCRYIVTIHDILFMDYPEYFPLAYRLKNKLLFRKSANKSDIVLTVSEFSKKQLQRHFNISDVLITTNAVDAVFFEAYDKAQTKREVNARFGLENYWIYISRREPRKNHLALLKVFAENGYHKNFQLVFIGNKAIADLNYDDYFSTLPEHIRSRVLSCYKTDSETLLQMLRAADLSVYPSLAEGFGIPPLEAAAAQIPSIFSGTTAMADFDFMADMMFEPSDLKSIGDRIEYVLKNDIRKDYPALIKERYSWENAAGILKDAIDNFAG